MLFDTFLLSQHYSIYFIVKKIICFSFIFYSIPRRYLGKNAVFRAINAIPTTPIRYKPVLFRSGKESRNDCSHCGMEASRHQEYLHPGVQSGWI